MIADVRIHAVRAPARAGQGAYPVARHAHLVAERRKGGDPGGRIVQNRAVDGVGGQHIGLLAHADLDVGAGQHPVQIGLTQSQVGRAGAQSAAVDLRGDSAGGRAAPGEEAADDVEVGGKIFAGDEAAADQKSLRGVEVLVVLVGNAGSQGAVRRDGGVSRRSVVVVEIFGVLEDEASVVLRIVTFLEDMCYWGWPLTFQKPKLDPVVFSPLATCNSGCRALPFCLSATSFPSC